MSRAQPLVRRAAGLLALVLPLALAAGCALPPPAAPPLAVTPVARPDRPPAAAAVSAPPVPSTASAALELYYRRLQNDLLAQGLLRGDGGGEDAPFTDTMLARDFVDIALFDEYAAGATTLVSDAQESRLRRWDVPIRMAIEFGPSVPATDAARDRASVAAYAGRLSRLTGVPIEQVEKGGNFHVLVLSEDDREGYEDRLRALVPGIAESSVRAFTSLPRSTLCLVIAFSDDTGAAYSRAVALIRAEHPELLRTACVHEELAQGMGLANDSPRARPSIFNDDEEFGLLTRHDELLLRMLYDERMRTGMTAEEAAPVARLIAAELVGGPA